MVSDKFSHVLTVRGRKVPGHGSMDVLFHNDLEAFKPLRIVIPDEVARSFLISDVKVGINSQLMSGAPFPAALFSTTARVEQFAFDVIPSGRYLSVSVINITDEEQAFTCDVYGRLATAADVFKQDEGLDLGYRRSLLGLGYTVVKAGMSANVNVQPHVLFQPERLVIPLGLSEGLVVEGVKVVEGGDPRCRLGDTLSSRPASSFSESSEGLIELRPSRAVSTRDFISVNVSNRFDRKVGFCGAIVGDIHG